METQQLQLTFNHVALIICAVGILANILWISVYLRAYRIHMAMPLYPSIMDILVAIQATTDLILCIVAVIFNLWMISKDSNPNIQTADYNFMINLKSSACWITYVGSLSALVVIARVSHNVLVSKSTISTVRLVVKPTIFLFIISFSLGIASLWFNNEPGPSHIYACNDTSDQSLKGIMSSVGIMWAIAGNGFFVIRYYRLIIKYALKHASTSIARSSDTDLALLRLFNKYTGLQLNRLAVSGIMMTLAYFLSFSVIAIKVLVEIITGKRMNLWIDFFGVIMLYLYSSCVNGLTVCNTSPTYQKILKRTLNCQNFMVNTPSLHVGETTVIQPETTIIVKSMAVRSKKDELDNDSVSLPTHSTSTSQKLNSIAPGYL